MLGGSGDREKPLAAEVHAVHPLGSPQLQLRLPNATEQRLIARTTLAITKLVDCTWLTLAPEAYASIHVGPAIEETVYCLPGDDQTLAMRLVLGQAAMAKLGRAAPFVRLSTDLLPPFFLLTEGVSHLVHLAWATEENRQIRAETLETRAELEKFLLACCLWHGQQILTASLARRLFAWLFADDLLVAGPPTPLSQRYRRANRRAAKVASAWLQQGLASNPRPILQSYRRYLRTPPG